MKKSLPIAVSGMMMGVSVVLQYIASISILSPGGIATVAGLCPLVSRLLSGRFSGYLCWGGSSLLGLLLVPDKVAVLLYALCYGLYPLLKGEIEGRKNLALEWVLKLAYFNLTALLLFESLLAFFLPEILRGQGTWILLGILNLVFIVYDFALTGFISLLQQKLKQIKGGKHFD